MPIKLLKNIWTSCGSILNGNLHWSNCNQCFFGELKRENKSPIEITTINSHVMLKLEKCANTILAFVNMKFIITLFQIICSSAIFIYCSTVQMEWKFCVVHKWHLLFSQQTTFHTHFRILAYGTNIFTISIKHSTFEFIRMSFEKQKFIRKLSFAVEKLMVIKFNSFFGKGKRWF